MPRRRRRTKQAPVARPTLVDRLSHLYDLDGRVIEFEQLWSATPLDPARWAGWRIDRLGPGWVAVRAR